MRGGAIIGVPLTILQLGVHTQTGAHVDPLTIANNFVACNAIYDADRATHEPPWPTRLSALASTAFYACNAHTAPLALLVPPLHLAYKSTIKPAVAPVKPFVVAALWTTCVYFVPIWRTAAATTVDVHVCAALFLSIAALSHAVDGVDVDEDAAEGLQTPAVMMRDGGAYAVGLGLASALLDATAAHPAPLYDVISLLSILGIVYDSTTIATVLGVAFVVQFGIAHDYELISMLLKSTEASHHLAIQASADVVDFAFTLDEPWRSRIIEPTLFLLDEGDQVGHRILTLLKASIRRRM